MKVGFGSMSKIRYARSWKKGDIASIVRGIALAGIPIRKPTLTHEMHPTAWQSPLEKNQENGQNIGNEHSKHRPPTHFPFATGCQNRVVVKHVEPLARFSTKFLQAQ